MDSFIYSLNATVPVFAIMIIGQFLKRIGIIDIPFANIANKFVFKVCLPCLLFQDLAVTNIRENFDLSYVGFCFLATLSSILVIWFLAKKLLKDKTEVGAFVQCSYRSSAAILGIAFIQNIYGTSGMAPLMIIGSVPLYNILAVISLSIFNRDENKSGDNLAVHVCKEILKNPLIQGVVLGMFCVAIRPFCGSWRFSTSNFRFIYKAFDALGSMAPWLSLIILGGQFQFSAVKKLLPKIIISTFARLIVAPAIGMVICIFLPPVFGFPHFSPAEYAALFALYATPEAVASIAMADQMGGDSELAGQILVWTTIFSALTLFLFVAFFRHTGIF